MGNLKEEVTMETPELNGSITKNQQLLFDRIRQLELTITELRGELKTIKVLGVLFFLVVELSMPVLWHLTSRGGA